MKRARALGLAAFGLVAVVGEPAYRQLAGVPAGGVRAREEAVLLSSALEAISTLRKTCAHADCSGQLAWSGFCVEVAKGDPGPAVMEGLARLSAPVRPVSLCGGRGETGTLRLPPAHLLLWAQKPTWISGGVVQVAAGDRLGDQAGAGYRLTLVRAWGRWWCVWRTREWVA